MFSRKMQEIHVNACIAVKALAGFLKCKGGKLEDSELYNCFFIVSVSFLFGLPQNQENIWVISVIYFRL